MTKQAKQTKQTKGQRDRNAHTTADAETLLHVELATEEVFDGWDARTGG